MTDLRFGGRVAIVTGAGGQEPSLGRSHAKLLAERGAKVVVNDLGVGPDGRGIMRANAEQVAEEISRRAARRCPICTASPTKKARTGRRRPRWTLGPARHRGEQCRGLLHGAFRRDLRRRHSQRHRRAPDGGRVDVPGSVAPHAGRGLRTHREHYVGCDVRDRAPFHLWRRQGRHLRIDPWARRRRRGRGYQGQRVGPGRQHHRRPALQRPVRPSPR